MLDSILSLSTAGLTVPEFIFCTVFSILFGVVIAWYICIKINIRKILF